MFDKKCIDIVKYYKEQKIPVELRGGRFCDSNGKLSAVTFSPKPKIIKGIHFAWGNFVCRREKIKVYLLEQPLVIRGQFIVSYMNSSNVHSSLMMP